MSTSSAQQVKLFSTHDPAPLDYNQSLIEQIFARANRTNEGKSANIESNFSVQSRSQSPRPAMKPFATSRSHTDLDDAYRSHMSELYADNRRSPGWVDDSDRPSSRHPWLPFFSPETAVGLPTAFADSSVEVVHGFKMLCNWRQDAQTYHTFGDMALLELLVYLLINGEVCWTFPEFDSEMRALVCSDWNKCDIHGEWSMNTPTAYDDNLTASVMAMWQLPFPRELLLFFIRLGCPMRNESVRMINQWASVLCQLVQRAWDAADLTGVLPQLTSLLWEKGVGQLVIEYASFENDDLLFGRRLDASLTRRNFVIRQWMRRHLRRWIVDRKEWAPSATARCGGLEKQRLVEGDCLLKYKIHNRQGDSFNHVLFLTGEYNSLGLEDVANALKGDGRAGMHILCIMSRPEIPCVLRCMVRGINRLESLSEPTLGMNTGQASRFHIASCRPELTFPFVTFDEVDHLSSTQALCKYPTTKILLIANPSADVRTVVTILSTPQLFRGNRCVLLRLQTDRITASLFPGWTLSALRVSSHTTHYWYQLDRNQYIV